MFSLATTYDEAKHGHLDLWAQFKRRGVRCIWHNGEFYTRNRKNEAPRRMGNLDHLKKYMPPITTDGELYVHGWSQGRINGAVNVLVPTEDTRALQFWAFDHPQNDKTWIERRPTQCDAGTPYYVMEVMRANAGDHKKFLYLARTYGFEGVVFRTLTCLPIVGRNSTILKCKPLTRAEYICHDVIEGKKGKTGRQLGKVGALVLETEDGQHFRVGRGWDSITAELLWNDAPIGKRIVIEYKDDDDGIPQEATFICVSSRHQR